MTLLFRIDRFFVTQQFMISCSYSRAHKSCENLGVRLSMEVLKIADVWSITERMSFD